MQRIQTLDGLRFLAVVGVLWIHTWTLFGNPRCFIGGVDIAGLLAIGGNGVDLFFVISGFCMYYFYAAKSQFSFRDYKRFIIKRWVRLSPAFYAATLIYLLIEIFIRHTHPTVFLDIANSLLYLNSIFQHYNVAGHFWSLGVEWQFYLIIPFILIYQNRIGFKKIFLIIFFILFFTAILSVLFLKDQSDLLTDQILFRYVEFAAGIVAARILIKNTIQLKMRWLWLILFIIVTYAGRVFISKSVLNLSANYYNLFKLIGFGLMGAGFAGILYMALTSVKWLNAFLGNYVFKQVGRVSYSFYLWHGFMCPVTTYYVTTYLPQLKGISGPMAATFIGLIIIYPISMLSYNLLEKPFLSVGNLTAK